MDGQIRCLWWVFVREVVKNLRVWSWQSVTGWDIFIQSNVIIHCFSIFFLTIYSILHMHEWFHPELQCILIPCRLCCSSWVPSEQMIGMSPKSAVCWERPTFPLCTHRWYQKLCFQSVTRWVFSVPSSHRGSSCRWLSCSVVPLAFQCLRSSWFYVSGVTCNMLRDYNYCQEVSLGVAGSNYHRR